MVDSESQKKRKRKKGMSWKAMIDLGLFDDCFPQRVNACFRYLTQDSEDKCRFHLKDLVEKGPFAFSYLGIKGQKDAQHYESIMDTFRSFFDRSACGQVDIENFALGNIEKLVQLRYSNVERNETL